MTNFSESKWSSLYCPRPFNDIHYAMDGAMGPCCVNNFSKVVPIQEYLTSDVMQQIRNDVVAGTPPPQCGYCNTVESTGSFSHRSHANRKIESYQLSNAEVRFSNVCNFKCRTCVAATSSAIAAEERKFNITDMQAIRFSGPDDSFVLNELKSIAHSLTTVSFSGGEPLLQWQHWALIDYLIETNLTPDLMYYSNGSSLSFKGTDIIRKWQHFDNVHYRVSIDAIGAQAEYWRHGTRWEEILANVKTVVTSAPHVRVTCIITVSWVNILSVGAVVDAVRGIDPSIECSLNAVVDGEFSLQVLPESNKREIVKYLDGLRQLGLSSNNLSGIISFMMGADKSYLLPKAIANLDEIDIRRGESFLAVFPEHAALFNESRVSNG